MKKLLLGTVIGAALTALLPLEVHAASVHNVYSDITNIQLWSEQSSFLIEASDHYEGLQFSGTATDADDDGYVDSANIRLTGLVRFTFNDVSGRMLFNLHNGNYAPGSGITFSNGQIGLEFQSSEGWIPYPAIDASVTNFSFLADQPGALSNTFPDQTTAGIIRNTLPGLWDGEIGSTGFNRAVSSFTLLGLEVGFYMEGEIGTGFPNEGGGGLLFGPPEVPVPGAVWLFGSALAGLAGVRRWRG